MDATINRAMPNIGEQIGRKSQSDIINALNQFSAKERFDLDMNVFRAIFGDDRTIKRSTLAETYPYTLSGANMMTLRRGASISSGLPVKSRYLVPVYATPKDDECESIAKRILNLGVQSLDQRAITAILSDYAARAQIVKNMGVKTRADAERILHKYDWAKAANACGDLYGDKLNESIEGITNLIRTMSTN